jgi:hypothetical protein
MRPDGSGLSTGVGADNGGNGLVMLTWVVDPGCAPEPPGPEPGPGPEDGAALGAASAIVAEARFTG